MVCLACFAISLNSAYQHYFREQKYYYFSYELNVANSSNVAIQDRKDAEKLKLLEQQLAYVQWKKRKNGVKMKEAIAVRPLH